MLPLNPSIYNFLLVIKSDYATFYKVLWDLQIKMLNNSVYVKQTSKFTYSKPLQKDNAEEPTDT